MLGCHLQVTITTTGPQLAIPGSRQRSSPLADALARVGDRWTLLVVEALLRGPRRFGELQTEVGGIAPNILTGRLRHLEREGLVVARPYSRRPVRLAYELTAAGRELAGALALLTQWGASSSGDPEALRHSPCGTPVEARWFCPTCGEIVDDVEADELRYV